MAIYVLSLLAKKYSIRIGRLIVAPRYGKGYADGLNAVYKQYWEKIMMFIESSNEENYNIKI